LPYIFTLIGISAIGPILGSLFASLQGAGIMSGSIMSLIQSFVMCGWALTAQLCAVIFWATLALSKIALSKIALSKIALSKKE